MSQRLRDLIKNVRACKTAAEEREVISKESAAIRDAIKNEVVEYRQRNVAKMLYIHMLGHPTHFGQMECLKLIVSQSYSDKRVGYLGLMHLLDEKQEVLMLVTNSLKKDLNHPNQFVVGLALCALGNISSPGIARDTATDVEKLLGSTNNYVRKKAALCAIRIVRKVPELMENFVSKIKMLLSERNHAVLITAIQLAMELCNMDASVIEQLRKPCVPNLVRILKSLVLSGYAPEYDVSGITDPFLQVKVLQLLRLLGHQNPEASDAMNDILAQVATNTENMRNVGNAVLYECVQTIMSIESEAGLRVLAINILGRFLLNRDNNIRYVALNSLSKVVHRDAQAVQRHRTTIVDCLKDPDISIRRRALDLVYALVNESNIRILVREMLNFLLIADVEFRADLTTKLCAVTEKYAPNKRWHVDTIIRVMSIAGAYVRDEVPNNLVMLIAQTPDLQTYAVQKLYLTLTQDCTQQLLVQVGVWCIGEYGDLLVRDGNTGEESLKVSENDVVDLLALIMRHPSTLPLTKDYVLTALVKLTSRFSQLNKIKDLFQTFQTSLDLELQQRACEYTTLLEWSNIRAAITEPMPIPEPKKQGDTTSAVEVPSPVASPPVTRREEGPSLFPVDEPIFDTKPPVRVNTGRTDQPSDATILSEIFGNGSGAVPVQPTPVGGLLPTMPLTPMPLTPVGLTPTPAGLTPTLVGLTPVKPVAGPVKPAPAPGPVDPLASLVNFAGGITPIKPAPSTPTGQIGLTPTAPVGLTTPVLAPTSGGLTPLTPLGAAPAGPAGIGQTFKAFEKNGVTISFTLSEFAGGVLTITATFQNANPQPLTDFLFQTSVPKYIRTQLASPSSTVVPPNNSGVATQQLKLINSLVGQKPILMKLKVDYKLNGAPVTETGDVANFPAGF